MEMREPYIEVSPFVCRMYSVIRLVRGATTYLHNQGVFVKLQRTDKIFPFLKGKQALLKHCMGVYMCYFFYSLTGIEFLCNITTS